MMPNFRAITFVLATFGLVTPGVVRAQAVTIPAGPRIVAARAGECIIRIDGADTRLAAEVEVDLNRQPIRRQAVNGRQQLEYWVAGPMAEGDQIRARYITAAGTGAWSATVDVGPSNGNAECQGNAPLDLEDDPREAVEATAYVGTAIDNFAPAIVGNYREHDEKHRFVGGVNFQFRVWPTRNVRKNGPQVWINGETLHGVRTADVDCTTDPKPAVCNEALAAAGQSFRFILKRASSFEAFVQPRVEIATIEPDSEFATRVYLTGRFGMMMLTEGDGYAAEAHHVGIGIGSVAGKFDGSFLEVGWGKTELFAPVSDRQWNRLKLDALLTIPFLQSITERARFWRMQPRFFIQLYGDFDPGGKAADSIQTFIGFDMPIGDLLK